MADATHEALQSFLAGRERLIRIACRIVDSRAVAEELVQDSWLRWQRHDYSAAKARPIFSTIVANLARDWTRRSEIERETIAALNTSDTVASSEQTTAARQELRIVVATLSRLPKRSVLAFRMHCIDGLAYAEIGRRLGLSRSRSYELVADVLVELTLATNT